MSESHQFVMPIDFHYVSEHRLVITRFHGVVTDNDIELMYNAIFDRPDIEPGYIELSLHEDDFVPEVTKEGLITQIQRANQFHGTNKTPSANVVGKHNHEVMLEFFKSMIAAFPDASEKVKLFTSIYDALEYLGIEPLSIPYSYHRFACEHQLTYEDLTQPLREAQRERDETAALYKALLEQSNPYESVLFFLKNQRISDGLRRFVGREDVICPKD